MNRATPTAVLLMIAVTTACSPGPSQRPVRAVETNVQAHGYVVGAAEVQEQQRTLAAVGADGQIGLLDLATEEVVQLGGFGPVAGVATDGRFVVVERTDGTLALLDSGVWTTNHGDHVHHYRAVPTVVGDLPLVGRPEIVSTETRTAVSAGNVAVLLDREALGQGSTIELARSPIDQGGLAAPIDADRWAVTTQNTLLVLDRSGQVQARADCVDPRGGTVTRVGVVAGCADGALLVTVTGDAAVIESMPYPADTDPITRATAFDGRADRPTVAAVAPGVGFWLLDTRERTWQLVATTETPSLVTAVDDRVGHVVGVLPDGTVTVWDAAGTELGRAAQVAGPPDESLHLSVDADRAYLPGTSPGTVVEIDFRDNARVARTLTLPAADHVVEVGL